MKRKIKYLSGLAKMVCMKKAVYERKKISRSVAQMSLPDCSASASVELDIISFSGKRDWEEQYISIYSFLYYVGVPSRWIIYSDGSHTEEDKQQFYTRFSFVEFRNWDFNNALTGHPLLKAYREICPLSKKLQSIVGHEYTRQTMYVDSDIVFYKNASLYFHSEVLKRGCWYLPDTNWGTLDTNGFSGKKDMYALNSGLLILNQQFNFEDIFEYLEGLDFKFEYFSEQNSFDYAFKKQQAGVLDPRQFIVSLEDQFKYSIEFEADEIAARHYVTPVRHKIWQNGWGWHFKN